MTTDTEKLRERAAKIRGWIASSQRVVDLLAPEMEKFGKRDGHDVYTVRMAVDHQSSIRTQTQEAEQLEQAADELDRLRAELAEARKEKALIVAYLDRMKVEASELGQTDAVFWIVQIRRDIERGEHRSKADANV